MGHHPYLLISSITFLDVIVGDWVYGLFIILFFLFIWIYPIYFFGKGQTIGMEIMRIKLCKTDGTYPIGYWDGFVRCIGMSISGAVFYLGYLWILIDKNNQGWHDKIADTYVVKVK